MKRPRLSPRTTTRLAKLLVAAAVVLGGTLLPPLVGETVRLGGAQHVPSLAVLGQPSLPPIASSSGISKEIMGASTMTTYPTHQVMATIFWIGEGASAENDYITNTETAWDADAVKTFGGIDDLAGRKADGSLAFTPRHNPFYFALPAIEFDDKGVIAAARQASYWRGQTVPGGYSLFKGRWIEVKNLRTGDTAYAQWLDVGPNEERDYGYVFGGSTTVPKNHFGLKAGLDLSPATATALHLDQAAGGERVAWRFVNEADVPDGAWRQYPAIDARVRW